MDNERYQRGLAKMQEVGGPEQAQRVLDGMQEIAPDLARYTIEFPYGDIYSRPGLDLPLRQLATIAALTALGTAPAQLRFHIAAGLNVGLTREQIVEVIMQMAVYAGFPAALNGIAAAREVFAAQDKEAAS